jgi:hypothetical protein
LTIRAIDDEVDPLAHLVAGQPLADHPAGGAHACAHAVKDVLPDAPRVGEAVFGQRPVYDLDRVQAGTHGLQHRLGAVGHDPPPWLRFGREAIAFQALHTVDQDMTILPDQVRLSLTRPEVDDTVLLLLGDHHPVDPGQPLGVHLAGELLSHLDLALVAQFPGHQVARPVTDPVGDVVARDVEDLAVAGDAPHDDVGVGMAGVVMVHRDPIETGVEVLLDLAHQVAREAAEVSQFDGVLGGDDEAEMVPVAPAPGHERAAVRVVLQGRVGMALVAVAGNAVALQVAQVRVGRPVGAARKFRATPAALFVLRIELHDAGLDDDPARPESPDGIPLPTASIGGEGELGAATAGVETPTPFSGRSTDPVGVAAGLADGRLDLLDEGLEARVGAPGAAP